MPLSSLPSSGELYRLIVENIIELVAVLDAEGEPFSTPCPVTSTCSATRPPRSSAATFGGSCHPDDLAHGRTPAASSRGTESRVALRRSSGSAIAPTPGSRSKGSVSAVEAEDGSKLLLLTATDITERVRHERAEREFVANAAHELLTPLTAMTAAIDVLQTGAKEIPVERDAFLADLEREVERLARLAYALLALARVQATGEALRVQAVELSPLVHQVAESVTTRDGVEIDVACPPDLAVLAERDLLERAIANLAENAAAHTARGAS